MQKVNQLHHQECPWCHSKAILADLKVPDRSGSGLTFQLGKCQDCNFLFTADPPDPDSIGPFYEFESYVSHSDTQSGPINRLYHWVRERMLERKARILQKAVLTDKPSVLDYGSGTGYFLNHLQKKGWPVTGVEINATARVYAQENFKVKVYDPDQLDEIGVDGFHVISLWHVLEHLYDFKEKLQWFYDHLQHQGVLILALPNYQSLDAQRLKEDWAAYDAPRHLWHFDPLMIEKVGAAYNLELIDSYRMPLDGYYVSMLSEQIKGTSSFLSLLKGGWLGLQSHINCTFNPDKASSLIYVLRKK